MGITSSAYPLNRQSFGIHSVGAVNRSTGKPYGMLAIVGDASINLEASSVDNRGGSNLFPWGTEITELDSNASFTLKSWPDWVYTVFFGASVSTTAASASTGTVSALVNYLNTSVFDASTGIATATLKSGEAANLKFNHYIIVATAATTVDVYTTSNFDFTRGTDLFFDDDELKITASDLTVTASTATEIPGSGVEITGGSGTIGMSVGDVAVFEVAPPHNGISDISIGQSGIVFPEHELWFFGKKRASGECMSVRCYKAQAVSGGSIPLSQSDFASTDITCKLLVDSTYNRILDIRYLAGII
jgi:hypothetical protein